MAKSKVNSFEAREKKSKKRSSIVKMSELREDILQSMATSQKEEVKPAIIETKVAEPVVEETVVLKKEEPIIEAVTETSTENETISVIIEDKNFKNMAIATENTPLVSEKTVPTEPAAVNVVSPIPMESNETTVINDNITVNANIPVNEPVAVTETTTIEEPVVQAKKSKETTTKKNKAIIASNKEIDKDTFFNLSIKNDVFEGKITTVRVYDDILDTLKKYAALKNYPIIEFTNKVITLGLDDLTHYGILQISEIKMKNNTSRAIMYNLTEDMEEKLNKYINSMNEKGYKISRNVILNVLLNETFKKFH